MNCLLGNLYIILIRPVQLLKKTISKQNMKCEEYTFENCVVGIYHIIEEQLFINILSTHLKPNLRLKNSNCFFLWGGGLPEIMFDLNKFKIISREQYNIALKHISCFG